MRKITLEDKHNKKKLTLYIADDAFEGIDLPKETQETILNLISEKLFNKTQGQQIIYLTAITLPNPVQTKPSFIFNDITNGAMSRGNIEDLTPPDQTHQIQIQDLAAEGSSYHQPQNMRRNLFKKILLEKRVCEEQEVDTLLACLLDDPATNLQAIKQEIFSDVPKDLPAEIFNALNEPVDKIIASISRSITSKRNDFVEMVENILCCRSNYNNAILPLASEIYDAAKSYYFEIWKRHGNDSKMLHQEREKFNELFNDIAHIDEEFNISSIKKTIGALRSRSKKLDELERTIAELLQNAYKRNESAFKHLYQNLENLKTDEFYSVTGTIAPWTWTFSFEEKTKTLYNEYNQSINKVYDLPLVGYFVDLTNTLKKKVEDGSIKVRETASRSKQNQQHAIERYTEQKRVSARKQQRQERREEIGRNKATIISLCIGAAIAIGVGIGIAFAPIILPTLVIAGIIAVTAAVILGVSAIIGRIIDTCKPAAKETVSASAEESQRLVRDFDHELEAENTGKPIPFLIKKSSHSSNNLFKDNTAGITPAAATNVSVSTHNYK